MKGDFTHPYKQVGRLKCEEVALNAMVIYGEPDHYIANENDHELATLIDTGPDAKLEKYNGDHSSRPYYAWKEEPRLEESLDIASGGQGRARLAKRHFFELNGIFLS